jgi:hypothetical protein
MVGAQGAMDEATSKGLGGATEFAKQVIEALSVYKRIHHRWCETKLAIGSIQVSPPK